MPAASMGPRRGSRGRLVHRRCTSRRSSLQWGHDEGVVEDATALRRSADSASMGPRRRSRGRRRLRRRTVTTAESFNGATTKESWKTHASATCDRRASGFNGATTKESWKTGFRRDVVARASKLQWGHDEGVVEDGVGSASVDGGWRASMGPRRRSRGRPSARTLQCGALIVASMGPRRRSRGRRRSKAARGLAGLEASMGPRRRSRGRATASATRPSRQAGFNGATARESWKTLLRPDAKAAGHATASMGPRRRSRGRRPDAPGVDPCTSASMGPRRRSRGRRCSADLQRPRDQGFNGATTKESWKTQDRPTPTAAVHRASMGPRRRSRGRASRSAADVRRSRLQWGHDEGVVEDARNERVIDRTLTLQWGHDEGVVEDGVADLRGP